MPQIDLPLEELRGYRPPIPVPSDLDDFWRQTLEDAARHDLSMVLTPVETGLVAVETYDVSFAGFGGDPVRAWLHLPAAALRPSGRLPGVVQYQGYNGGRGLAHQHLWWALAGFVHLVVDTRGQGSGWAVGDTPDPVGSAPSQPGYLTRGIESRWDYYYRRAYVDAVRAVEVLVGHPLVDAARVCATGISQGGGLALAVAGLSTKVAAVMSDVPFLCDFRRATRLAPGEPYGEIVRYLSAHRDRVEPAFQTLSYFDGVVLGTRASVPALFSVALMDQTTPPSTVFAAYNAYAGPKEIVVYEFNDHEAGEAHQQRRQLDWLRALMA
jgi:cephalosporin-C deacetylase